MAEQRDRIFMHAQVDTIVDRLRELIELARNSPADATNINNVVKDLQANARGLTDEIAPIFSLPTLSGRKTTFDVKDLSEVLKTINVTAGGASTTLHNFLSSIGSSLIEAQKSLNQQSRDYSQAAAVEFRGLVPASQFLIPSVKAEMTVGLDQVQERTVNLIFIKDSTTKDNFVQSKISFDLVAAPPPPGAVIDLTPFLLLNGRQAFLTELEALPEVATALDITNTIRFGAVFVVSAASTHNSQDQNVFLAVYVVQDKGKSILDPNWKTIVLVVVQRVNGKLTLYDKLLEATDSNPLVFPKTRSDKVVSLGDALMQMVAAIYQWMASLGFAV